MTITNPKAIELVAQIKKGVMSLYCAKQEMGEELTPEIEEFLRNQHDATMTDIYKYQSDAKKWHSKSKNY